MCRVKVILSHGGRIRSSSDTHGSGRIARSPEHFREFPCVYAKTRFCVAVCHAWHVALVRLIHQQQLLPSPGDRILHRIGRFIRRPSGFICFLKRVGSMIPSTICLQRGGVNTKQYRNQHRNRQQNQQALVLFPFENLVVHEFRFPPAPRLFAHSYMEHASGRSQRAKLTCQKQGFKGRDSVPRKTPSKAFERKQNLNASVCVRAYRCRIRLINRLIGARITTW